MSVERCGLLRKRVVVAVLFVFPVVALLMGCLFLVPAPQIASIDDQVVSVGEELTVQLVADGMGRDVAFTYEIHTDGWVPIEGDVFRYTFDDQGEYIVTIKASNGLRDATTVFTVLVEAVP